MAKEAKKAKRGAVTITFDLVNEPLTKKYIKELILLRLNSDEEEGWGWCGTSGLENFKVRRGSVDLD